MLRAMPLSGGDVRVGRIEGFRGEGEVAEVTGGRCLVDLGEGIGFVGEETCWGVFGGPGFFEVLLALMVPENTAVSSMLASARPKRKPHVASA